MGRNSFLPVQFRRGRAKLVEQLVNQLAGERFTLRSFYRSGERLENFVHHVANERGAFIYESAREIK